MLSTLFRFLKLLSFLYFQSFGGESSSSLSSFGSSTSFMSDSSEANSSVIEDDSESDEDEDAAKAADHARIIKRFTFRRPHIGSAELRLDLHSLFGCFVLAILTDHRSCITWTDLCFWIRTGALGLRLVFCCLNRGCNVNFAAISGLLLKEYHQNSN